MSGPPGLGPRQPWWLRAGGAPLQGQPARFPPPLRRPVTPPSPPRRQTAPPRRHVSPAAVEPKRTRRRIFIWAGITIILVEAVVLVAALWGPRYFKSKVLDVRQAELGVQQILSDPINGYGANDVAAVKCNDGRNPTIQKGQGFSCQVTINGTTRQVQVVFRDDAGTFEVDGPR